MPTIRLARYTKATYIRKDALTTDMDSFIISTSSNAKLSTGNPEGSIGSQRKISGAKDGKYKLDISHSVSRDSMTP